jgi:hypothetical protein
VASVEAYAKALLEPDEKLCVVVPVVWTRIPAWRARRALVLTDRRLIVMKRESKFFDLSVASECNRSDVRVVQKDLREALAGTVRLQLPDHEDPVTYHVHWPYTRALNQFVSELNSHREDRSR